MRSDGALNDFIQQRQQVEKSIVEQDEKQKLQREMELRARTGTMGVGPVPYDGEWPEMLPERYPFVMKLERALRDLGAVVVGFVDVPTRIGDGFSQYWVPDERLVENLAVLIVEKHGKSLVFAQMVIPPKHVMATSWQRAGNIGVRQVLDYRVGTDSVIQRWDVLVKSS